MQSGFIQGDTSINQLIYICNQLYQTLDNFDEVSGVFLDLSKAFDKVRHKRLIYKIENNVTLEPTFTNRKQKEVINGSSSSWYPTGSVMEPLLFLIHINEFCEDVTSDDFMFANDTSLFKHVNNNIQQAVITVNKDLDNCKLKHNCIYVIF